MANNKLRAIAIDDEQHCLDTLLFELERFCPQVEIIQTIRNVEEAKTVLRNVNIDVLFLDIHLQQSSGIDMLEGLMPVDYDVIFVTAYDEYAIKAFDLSAAHYLLKPVSGKQLQAAIDKIFKKQEKLEDNKGYLKLIQKLMSLSKDADKIPVPVQEGIEFIKSKDILYIKGESNYSTFILTDNREIMISKTLKYVEENCINGSFIRIHKSYIVNTSKISKYIKRDGGYVVLENGDKLSVSRFKKQIVSDLFK